MRKVMLAATLALAFTMAAARVAVAAPATATTVDLNGYANFSSILGGGMGGPVALSGAVSDGQLGALRGEANFPLRDEKITISATSSIALITEQLNVSWYRYNCTPFGCFFEQGFSVFERSSGSGPVDIRLGSLKGTGSISLGTTATCVSACPPPGAYWYAPYAYWQVQGAVLSSQDAGQLNMYGNAVTIH